MSPARVTPLPLLCVLAALWLAGCTRVPELDEGRSANLRQADYPALIPLDAALATDPPEEGKAETLERQLSGRRDRLKARARWLQAARFD